MFEVPQVDAVGRLLGNYGVSARNGSVPTVSTFVLVAKGCSNHTVLGLAPSAVGGFLEMVAWPIERRALRALRD